MSSLKDKKSHFWNTGIDTDHIVTLEGADSINRLLAHSDFDSLDMPEITTQFSAFNSHEALLDIKTIDDFHDSTLFMDTLVEKIPHFPVEIIAVIDEPQKPIILKNSDTALANTDNNSIITALSRSDTIISVANSAGYPDTSVMLADVTIAATAIPTALDNITVAPSASVIVSADTIVQSTNIQKPMSAYQAHQPFNSPREVDKYDKPVSEALSADVFACPTENISSLADNHTPVEKVADDAAILNNFVTQTALHQATRSDFDKHIQTSVTFTSTINETVHNSEWALFKAEQEKSHAHLKKRITQLEKSIRTAVLFSILAGILAGVSLIAAVSGLV
ncbi:hypothetical protein [Crenothrix polyspora]|uniref:Uncharacterized protein n=1 Tax=Crenothrix polyspora TaxID=360316 RepID=A0A1R4H5K5_9GAMM|nr:hypothetical protein [Crenothrix polyspora]SJM91542.1 hypothetical protein CRENPOLYSF1_20013 [Crenothrix polyspora]